MRLFGRFLFSLMYPLFYILYPYKVYGKENIPTHGDGPLIMCSNHISNLDPVFLLLAFKKHRHIYYMAKAELFKTALSRWFFDKQFGAFPVKRGTGDTDSLNTAERIVREGKLMGIFPEGTRSKNGQLGRAKSGASLIASRTGASILPVAIKTKDQKVRMFQNTYVIIGKKISASELHLDKPEKPDLRYSSRSIMENISKLMEENR